MSLHFLYQTNDSAFNIYYSWQKVLNRHLLIQKSNGMWVIVFKVVKVMKLCILLKIHKHVYGSQSQNKWQNAHTIILCNFIPLIVFRKNYVIISYLKKKFKIFSQNTWLVLCISTFYLCDCLDSISHRLNNIFTLVWVDGCLHWVL